MKHFCVLSIALLISHLSYAQVVITKDTAKNPGEKKIFTSAAQVPEFPGGYQEFSKYIGKNLHYPEVARLIGINGRLIMSFVVDKDGRITEATPTNCVGAGCEAEAVRLLEASPVWKPGIQFGKPVRVRYSIPISFTIEDRKIFIRDLRKSNYGFIFNIKGVLYTIDEVENILGKTFISSQVQIAEPFYNYNKVEKFEMPDKKEVYLLIFKST